MLITHRGVSAGPRWLDGLAEVLAVPVRTDPFAAEVVAVPAKGVERWLAQRLSHILGTTDGAGVCANVAFPWPSTLLDDAVRSTSPDHADAVERWAPQRAVWPLIEVVDEAAGPRRPLVPRAGPSPRATGGEDKGRRLAVGSAASRASSTPTVPARPDMLRAWADGRDGQGDGEPLAADLALAGGAVAPSPRPARRPRGAGRGHPRRLRPPQWPTRA